MAYKVHRNKWKGVKWIDSPFSARRKALASLMCRCIAAQGYIQFEIIRNAPSSGFEPPISKVIKLADVTLKTVEAIKDTRHKILYGDRDA